MAGQIDTALLQQADHLRRRRTGATAEAAEFAPLGEILAGDGLGNRTEDAVVLVEEEDAKDLARLGLPGDREYRLLADVLGLVGNALERIENAQVGEEILDAEVFPFGDQIGEDDVEGPLDLIGHDHRRPGLLGVAVDEGANRLLEHLP